MVRTKTLFWRPGRPRTNWVVEAYEDACSFLFGPHTVFDISDYQLLCNITQAAVHRTGPFATRLRLGLCRVSKAFEPRVVLLLVLSIDVLFDA